MKLQPLSSTLYKPIPLFWSNRVYILLMIDEVLMSLLATLQQRGLIEATTHDLASMDEFLAKNKPVAVYTGFDPSADSLHMGNYVPIRLLKWFRDHGHTVFALVGGATGMIGDPSGKNKERAFLNKDVLDRNTKALTHQLKELLGNDVQVLNNADWYGCMTCIDYLRNIGKFFRLGSMLAKESVKTRLASEEGMSYTEFSYQVLQGYDFEYLHRNHGVMIQMGGSDQWGNITAGVDFAKRVSGAELMGVAVPLLLKSDGTKFGKSEHGALWLSEDKLSSYDLYQHMLRVADADVIRMLLRLTDVSLDEIEDLEQSMTTSSYVPSTAQKLLAQEVVQAIRGEDGLKKALVATKIAQPGNASTQLTKKDIEAVRGQIPESVLTRKQAQGARLDELLVHAQFCASKSEVRRLIKNGGLTINSRKIEDEFDTLQESDCIDQTWLLVSCGKKNRRLIMLT